MTSTACKSLSAVLPLVYLICIISNFANARDAIPRDALRSETFRVGVTIDERDYSLEAFAVYPPGDGPFPLALFAHGSPRGGTAGFSLINPQSFMPQMDEFARRGYASVIILRRGFGESTGPVVEFQNVCERADHRHTTREAGKDLRAAVAILRTNAMLDMSRFIAVGQSTGGMAVLSMTREPIEGLAHVFAFAPIRGSRSSNDTCNPNSLVEAMEEIGRTSRVPSTWVYTSNDTFASVALARRMHAGYVAAGGVAELVELPPWGTDGHFLFSRAGIPDWRPIVDRQLWSVGLPNWSSPPADRPWPETAPPAGLSAAAQAGWEQYIRMGPHKAFAANSSGSWSYRFGFRSPDAARAAALQACHSQRGSCRIVAVDDEPSP
jgi:dienelactone hydrolase